MGADEPNLPVDDDEIETIEDWREEIGEFLKQMYAIRVLCEIDPHSGTRFGDLKETLAPPSPSTLTRRKDRAVELYLIEPVLKNTEKGYGTHTFYQFTNVGRHIRAELDRRQVTSLHQQLKPLEQQYENHKNAMKNWVDEVPMDPLEVLYGDPDE